MKLVNTIFIRRPPNAVWDFLKDPENMPRWNPNVTYVSPSGFADIRQGYRYSITYYLHGNTNANRFQGAFIQFEPPVTLVIRLTEEVPTVHNRIVEERYDLAEQNGGTLLTQSIRVENSGINVFVRGLIWAIQKWGKPVGKPHLADLRDFIEGDGNG